MTGDEAGDELRGLDCAGVLAGLGRKGVLERRGSRAAHVRDDGFSFGNDKRMGTCTLRTHELWDEVRRASREYESALAADDGTDPEAVGDWLSSVLFQLGFEGV